MNRQGLKKVKKTIKGGRTHSYWVRAQEGAKKVGRAVLNNKGKIAGAAALAGAVYLGHKVYGNVKSNREYRANQQAAYEAFKKHYPDFGSHVRARKNETGNHPYKEDIRGSHGSRMHQIRAESFWKNAAVDTQRHASHQSGHAPLVLHSGIRSNPPPGVGRNHRTEYTGSTEGAYRRDRSLVANQTVDSKRRWGAVTKASPLSLGSGAQTPHEAKLWEQTGAHHPGTPEHHRAMASVFSTMADRHVSEGFPHQAASNRIEARAHERTATSKAAGTHREPNPYAPPPAKKPSRPRKKK
jgi:hypothetical protein